MVSPTRRLPWPLVCSLPQNSGGSESRRSRETSIITVVSLTSKRLLCRWRELRAGRTLMSHLARQVSGSAGLNGLHAEQLRPTSAVLQHRDRYAVYRVAEFLRGQRPVCVYQLQ